MQLQNKIGSYGLYSIVVFYFFYTLILSLFYHWGFLSTLTDLGTFDQAIWSILGGDWFKNTNIYNRPVNYLGFHFRPILIAFVPFYYILPKAEWLILAQSIALSLSGIPIFFIAKKALKSDLFALFWVLIFFFNPFILSGPPWVFRPETLAVPFIAFAFLSIENRNFLLTLLCCAMVLFCKEHFGPSVVGLGVLWGIRHRDFTNGLIIAAIGTLYSFIVLAIIIPALSPTGKHVMISSSLGSIGRYSWLGSSFGDIFQTLISNPIFVFKKLYQMGSFFYGATLFSFFLLFPLAAPEFLLVMSSDILANSLSANPMPRGLISYHSITLVPVLSVAAINGVRRFSCVGKKISVEKLTIFILITNIIVGYLSAPVPLPGALNYWKPRNYFNTPNSFVSMIKDKIGDRSSISVQSNIGSHFSQRDEIYQFPNKIDKVDFIVLCLSSPTLNIDLGNTPADLAKFQIGSLDAHLQMNRKEYLESIKKLLKSNYHVFFWRDPWLVIKRGTSNSHDTELVEQKLDSLQHEW